MTIAPVAGQKWRRKAIATNERQETRTVVEVDSTAVVYKSGRDTRFGPRLMTTRFRWDRWAEEAELL